MKTYDIFYKKDYSFFPKYSIIVIVVQADITYMKDSV